MFDGTGAMAVLPGYTAMPYGRLMSQHAFETIAAGLEDAIASKARARPPVDVKAIRAKTGKSQQAFADTYRLPVGTVRDWEQMRRQPDAPARVLLALIDADPAAVKRIIEGMRADVIWCTVSP
jgi:putative transcriptional regulator